MTSLALFVTINKQKLGSYHSNRVKAERLHTFLKTLPKCLWLLGPPLHHLQSGSELITVTCGSRQENINLLNMSCWWPLKTNTHKRTDTEIHTHNHCLKSTIFMISILVNIRTELCIFEENQMVSSLLRSKGGRWSTLKTNRDYSGDICTIVPFLNYGIIIQRNFVLRSQIVSHTLEYLLSICKLQIFI